MDLSGIEKNVVGYKLNEEEEKKYILKQYKVLLKKAESKFKTPEDKKNIKRAFQIAAEAHKETRRKTGEPYILHPIEVARIAVEEIGLGVRSIISSLLHDTVEDTTITLDFIKKEFGQEIATIVGGLTKISILSDVSKSKQAENIKKILVSLVEDPRVILIKLADRVHNMRTLDSMNPERRIKIASETMEIYVPIAHRLGLYKIKTELEDLCMKYLDSGLYNMINYKLKESKREREKYIKEFIEPIQKEIKTRFNFDFYIEGRTKSVYAIGKKMKTQNIGFEDVYDVFAIRIIVKPNMLEQEVAHCWQIYSVVSSMFKPLPNRLRDWLSQPKANGYEALHTTVLGPEGNWVEIQIRSERMNNIAERGIAAHYLYKEKKKSSSFDEWYLQIRDLISSDSIDSVDIITNFQNQIYEEFIYILTPKGDLKTLPSNATILDFAYSIHSNIGHKCIGAKVNHRLEALFYTLKTGDKVEVLTSEKQNPQEEWLEKVKTSKALNDIKTYFRNIKRHLQAKGQEVLMTHLKAMGFELTEKFKIGFCLHFGCEDMQVFYYK